MTIIRDRPHGPTPEVNLKREKGGFYSEDCEATCPASTRIVLLGLVFMQAHQRSSSSRNAAKFCASRPVTCRTTSVLMSNLCMRCQCVIPREKGSGGAGRKNSSTQTVRHTPRLSKTSTILVNPSPGGLHSKHTQLTYESCALATPSFQPRIVCSLAGLSRPVPT